MSDDGWSPDFLPHGRSSRRIRRLPGGFANPVWLCELDDGADVVVKASIEDCADMFATEAAGLEILAGLGGLTTPRVLAVGPRSIVLDALNPELPDTDEFWQAAGRIAARMHATTWPAPAHRLARARTHPQPSAATRHARRRHLHPDHRRLAPGTDQHLRVSRSGRMIELMRVNGLAAGAADSLAGGRRQVSTGSDRAFRALSLVLKVRPPRTGITLSTIGFEADGRLLASLHPRSERAVTLYGPELKIRALAQFP